MTPSRDKEPVFEVTGMPENVDRARDEIEAHIALRTGTCGGIEAPGADDNDFHFNGTDVSFEGATTASLGGEATWLQTNVSSTGAAIPPMSITGTQRINSNINGGVRMSATYRNDSSSSLGSGSSSADSFYGGGNGNRMADFSPTSPFNANSNSNNNNNNGGGGASFWFGDSLLPLGSEEIVGLGGGSSSGFDPLTISTAPASHPVPQPHMVWSPFVDHQGIQAFDARQTQVGVLIRYRCDLYIICISNC